MKCPLYTHPIGKDTSQYPDIHNIGLNVAREELFSIAGKQSGKYW